MESSLTEQFSSPNPRILEADLSRSIQLLDDALNSPAKSLLRVTKTTPLKRASLFGKSKGSKMIPEPRLLHTLVNTHSKLERSINFQDSAFTVEPSNFTTPLDNTGMSSVSFLDRQTYTEAADHLFLEFLESMQVHGSEQQVFETLLDFIKNCNHTLQDTQEILWLQHECDTWGLIYGLYRNRLGSQYEAGSMDQECPARPLSEKETVIELYKNDKVTRECQLVVDWLERNAERRQREQPCMEHYTDKTVAWENTLHQLQNKALGIPYSSSRPIVSKLDPDAPLRERKQLHDLDLEDEDKLLKEVFYEIRCGHLERAKELCMHCGQPWRAATLEGWRLHHDPNYDAPNLVGEKLPMEGNPNRDLWKLIAWRAASDVRLAPYARAINAALCGHLAALEVVCDTWSDLLWANLRVVVDIRVEKELRTSMLRSYIAMPDSYWQNNFTLEEVFTKLGASKIPEVAETACMPFHLVQKYLILDHIPKLMDEMQKWTKINDAQTLRFLAHLVLFFRMVGRSERDDIGDSILEKYVKELMKMREPQLVAYYVAMLTQEDQLTLYAEFLEDVVERDERLLCLSVAEKAGLDVLTITKTVVENIRSQRFSIEIPDLHADITPQDEQKISALEWVVFYPEQRAEAIWQANALIRHFLSVGKLEAARKAFNKIPLASLNLIIEQYQSSAEIGSLEELSVTQYLPYRVASSIREYLCHRTYLDAQEGFSDWFHHYHHAKPQLPVLPSGEVTFTEKVAFDHRMVQYNMELERWKLSMEQQTKMVKSQLYNVLTFPEGGWLVDVHTEKVFGIDEDEVDNKEENKCRQQQMESLRQLCIPQVVLLLLTLLHNMGKYMECIHLADLIVSEQYKLYKVHTNQKLQEVLNKISKSSLELLNQKRDPWGHSVSF